MSDASLILIAAPELIPALRERLGDDSDVQTFADSEPLRALEAIMAQRPAIVALERLFAASPRGAALISRIKTDPALDASEIRILSHDTDYQRISPRRRTEARASASAPAAGPAHGPALDAGTRRAPRFRMREDTEVTVDDDPAQIIDLSVIGAQVVSPEVLRPRQAVSLRLGPRPGGLKASCVVVWARLELSPAGPTYRAGLAFTSPDRRAIAAFCEAHKAE